MDEFKAKQKIIRKRLIVASIILGVVATIVLAVLVIVGKVLDYNTSNTELPYYGDGAVSGWVTIFEDSKVIGKVLGNYLILFMLFVIPIFMYFLILLIWAIYGIYYAVKYNKTKKDS